MQYKRTFWKPYLLQLTTLLLNTGTLERSYAATPDQLPQCYTIPERFLEGVNLLTGSYLSEHVDVMTGGVDPIVLRRFNSSAAPVLGWNYNITRHLYLSQGDQGECILNYPDGQGGLTRFRSREPVYYPTPADPCCPRVAHFFYDPKDEANASAPCYTYSFSGQQHLDNVQVETSDSGRTLIAYHGDGTVRKFTQLEKDPCSNLPLIYELEAELLPSGNERFSWCTKKKKKAGQGKRDVRIETRSAKGVAINHLILKNLHGKESFATTSEGRQAHYLKKRKRPVHLDSLLFGHFFREVTPLNGITQRYVHDAHFRLMCESLPDDRTSWIRYAGDGPQVYELHRGAPNSALDRQYDVFYRFYYPSREDGLKQTLVQPAERSQISVLSDKGKLLEYTRQIKDGKRPTKKPQYIPYSTQKLFWSGLDKREDLTALAFYAGSATQPMALRSFKYDDSHNMTEETLYGNLSGICTSNPSIDAKGQPNANGCESTRIRHTYTKDMRNLLIKTEEDSGKVTSYTYQPGTNLLTAELVGDGTQNIQRTFHRYNEEGVRIETIIDDGVGTRCEDLTGVTLRRLTRITPKTAGNTVGLPEVEEEFFLNEKHELQLLQKRVATYDEQGRLISRVLHDAALKEQKACSWVYDAAGRLLKTIDPAGEIEYVYDANNNPIEEHFLTRGLTHYNSYDRLNHLIQRREVDQNSQERIWRYRYNMHGQCVEETDPFEQKTVHRFDELGREIQTEYPPILSSQGTALSRFITHGYDACDFKVVSKNPSGDSEKMAYNMRGQITRHEFADGSYETKEYTLGGALKKSVSRLGLVTEYESDFLGRATTKKDFDQEGALLCTIHYVYKGLLLHSTIHEGGSTVIYHYDGAGRLIEQWRDGYLEHSYAYDSFGRLSVKKDWIDAVSARVTSYTYDQWDHNTSETVCDLQGTVLMQKAFKYDAQGNVIETRQKRGGTVAITKSSYNAWNQITEVIDPEGNTTRYIYETDVNHIGQKVQKVTRCDAKGYLHSTLYHANGQIAEEKDIDPLGVTLRSHQLFYNASNQVTERADAVYMQGAHIKTITTQWVYNKSGHVATLIEAVGTPEERQTHTLYTPHGQPKRVQLPSKDVHVFAYNVKGEKLQHYDERGSFAYRYRYDAFGNLTHALDEITGQTTQRQFDVQGRMLQETLGNGLTFDYQYDLLGRAQEITLPDGSLIAYDYDAAYLRSITRLDANVNVRYKHIYSQIDLSGNVLKAQLVGSCGQLQTDYTKRGQIQSIASAKWSQFMAPNDYDALGNLLKCTTHDPSGRHVADYAYDGLNQLTQETGQIPHAYTYDSLYNRQIQDGKPGEFNHLNQLLKRNNVVYTYDKNGQTLSIEQADQRTDYTYDGLGRLTSFTSEDTKATYTYDAFHRRLSKTLWSKVEGSWQQDNTQRFLYLDQNEIGSSDQDGKLTSLRVLGRGMGAEIGASIAIEINASVYVPVHDKNGSIAALLDAKTGQIAEYTRYSAFGQAHLFNAQGQALHESTIGNPWGYASKRLDLESGWTFFGRRYYNPQEGRWMSPDPLGFAEGPNLYAYVHNSPMNHFDLYGLAANSDVNPYTNPCSPYYQALANRVKDMTTYMGTVIKGWATAPGRLIEAVARHFLPCPGLRDACMQLGRVLSGRPPEGCEHCREYDSSNIRIEGHQAQGGRLFVTNGMLTSRSYAIANAQALANAQFGKEVYLTYNPTRGFILDLLRSLYMMLGGVTEASFNIVKNWKNYLKEALPQPNGAPGLILQYAHSQGAQVLWGAMKMVDPGILDRMEVVTYGAAKLISDGSAKSVRNRVSKRDAIPFIASPYEYVQAKLGNRENVTFLNSKGIAFIDHAFTGDTYLGDMRELGRYDLGRFPLVR